MSSNRTYRIVDGERIDGVYRPIFIRNGDTYFLTDLKVFADGALYYWEWGDIEGLRAKIDCGWVATSLPEGGSAHVHALATWRFGEPEMWVTADELIGEVADEIDRLNGRPDSLERCRDVAVRYAHSRAEQDRHALRAAYGMVPAHQRVYLGDMDSRDIPFRLLIAEVGGEWEEYFHYEDESGAEDGGETVTEQTREWAFRYFKDWDTPDPTRAAVREADGPVEASSPTVYLNEGRPMYPRAHGLRNTYPAPFTVAGQVYPTVEHAYWALSVADETQREAIRTAQTTSQAQQFAARLERRPGWSDARLAIMADLMRAKFAQHPDLADILLSTGDGRIVYSYASSPYWQGDGTTGRNWLGRLLELIRSELASAQIGPHL
ncbi:NADAR family protein [Actinocorallia aurantiaca]|uniref:Riboflavin biosynthesis intermediates N-glycosidase n=1 Tax=Actinocorallia aurantiaca TaxID=46204 RepID=A0ABP6H9B2_9ACTN